jgi:hypothetical protein
MIANHHRIGLQTVDPRLSGGALLVGHERRPVDGHALVAYKAKPPGGTNLSPQGEQQVAKQRQVFCERADCLEPKIATFRTLARGQP